MCLIAVAMEQPPGSLDDLQPQDLSTCSIPTVIDLTRKTEECVLNDNSLEALRMVKNPSWYPNSGSSKTSLPFTDTAPSDISLQSGDPIQPDNAFSNTTVTLSYVSRSHVFSTHDSLPQHSALYGVPSIGKFSLHPALYESEMGLGETGCTLSQHYLEQVDRPLDLATQTELLQSLSQAQIENENAAGVCLTQQSHEFNGGVISGDLDEQEHLQGGMDHSLSRDTESSTGLQNCQGNNWCNLGTCVESSPEPLATNPGEHQETVDPAVLFLISRTQELCSLSREFISPLDDPVSPSATSLDDVEDVFILPQASSSPSADNSFLEEADDTAWEGLDRGGPLVQPSAQGTRSSSDSMPRLDTSSEYKPPAHRRKAPLEPMIDLTDDSDFLKEVLENKPLKETAVPHLNGNAKAVQTTFQKKQLPARSGRGTRLEAIVMNINPGRYRVADSVRPAKKAKASQATASVSKVVSSKKDAPFVGKKKSRVKASISVKKTKLQAATPPKRGKANSINTDSCKESTSDSEINNSKNSHSSKSPKMSSPQFPIHKKSKKKPERISHTEPSRKSSHQFAVHKKSKKEPEYIAYSKPSPESSPQFVVHRKSKKKPECISHPEPPPETNVVRKSSPTKSPKKSPVEHKSNAAASKKAPPAKTKAAHPTKRRKKKHKAVHLPSMFSPKEPEIKLKYISYKEEKRDSRLDTFSPFIRVERKQLSLCTVINYPEEESPRQKKGQQQQQGRSGGFISGAVPSTSCLYQGRASTHSQHLGSLVCCLCGESANAMDLGDLHGPYYPEGYKPSTKTPASTPGLKEDEDDYSDSDSSCSMRGRRKCARPLAPWSHRSGPKLKRKGLLGGHQSWTSDSDHSSSPVAKRARTETDADTEEDWYSPPVVPLEPCEYWLHEDCGIWSAGVFLVKGKVYGLEEAVKVAQETVRQELYLECMCDVIIKGILHPF